MTQKSYAKGSELPDLKKDTLRLYGMRFCPFVERTRLVLAHKEIPFETINVHLKQKPDWFFEKNPLGLVPVLEYNDEIVYESAICDDYLDEKYPEKPLNPKDPYLRARQKMLMEQCAKVITNYYKCVRGNDVEESLQNLHKGQTLFEKELENKKYFGGDDPCMLDYHLWPWYERMPAVSKESGLLDAMVPADKFPNLFAWTKAMWELPAVKAIGFDAKTHAAYIASSSAGKPDYDMGL